MSRPLHELPADLQEVANRIRSGQSALFDADRLSRNDAWRLTVESLQTYGTLYRHWAVAFSGGKDSSATVTAVVAMIERGDVPAPESLTVLYADTRMELTPLHAAAMSMLAELERRGMRTRVVLPALDDRFFVYMLGRGVPPPSNTFRWCTPQIKVEPMVNALRSLRDEAGEKFLMLTGVRLGESAARDQRIALSCGKDGAECGQGWFQVSTPESVADTLAPLLHWRVCFVFDWLWLEAPALGFPTRDIAEVYGMDEEGSAHEAAIRTGCVGCNLASRDVALDRLLEIDRWKYLAPLKRLKPLYRELKRPCNRLRKDGTETRKDGSLVSNPQRMGPLTMDARRMGLAEVLSIQAEVNRAAGDRPTISLIDAEEEARILELIGANTWPNKWDGTEQRADAPMPIHFVGRGRGIQHVMPLEVVP